MTSAIILAAGTSSRMEGRNKLMLPLSGKTSLQIVAENILTAGIEDVIVVTGHESMQIRQSLESLPVRFVSNPDYKKGMTTSIQKGVSIAKGNGYMICLSDMPFIAREEYALMKTFFEEQYTSSPACICLPAYNGKTGNPVIFSSFFREEILAYTALEGCKNLVRSHPSAVHYCEMPGDGILSDIDTAEDYRLALSAHERKHNAS